MGVYKLEQIGNDFHNVTHGITDQNITDMRTCAIRIIRDGPDNASADFAISHLLQAAEMLACAHLAAELKIKQKQALKK